MLVFFGLLLKNGEDQVLLAHAAGIFDAELFAHFDQVTDFLFFQFAKMHSTPRIFNLGWIFLSAASYAAIDDSRTAIAVSMG